MIDKNSGEFKVWGEAYKLRDKYKDNPDLFTEKGFEQMVQDTSDLYNRYKDTDGDLSAMYLSMAIREMCNDEWHKKFGRKEG